MIKKRLPVFGWALYDFGNTIFSMNVISLYFVLWVTVDNAREDIFYSVALSGSLLLAAVLEPFLGAVSDIHRRKIPFLVVFTCSACLFTAVLGFVKGIFAGLVVFAAANFAFQIASVFYNALLVKVCRKEEIGRVSGLGVGLGYLGSITGLVVTRPFVLKYGHQAAFIPTAILFFIFSLPCFFLVKEGHSTGVRSNASMASAFLRIKDTFSDPERYSGLRRFLLAAFVFLNAVNTLIVFMAVYLKKVSGFTDSEMITLFIFSTFMAILGSLLFGVLTDSLGAKRSLIISLALWVAALTLAAVAFSKACFWFAGPLIGIALGAVWTSSRALAIRLCPEDKIGEMFGLFGLVGKSAAIVGPLVWGITVLAFSSLGVARYRIAILIQCLFILLGWWILLKVPEQQTQAIDEVQK